MIHWVLENDVFNKQQFEAMHKAALDVGCTVHHVRVKPFVHEIADSWGPPNVRGEPTICYGSIGITKVAAQQNWVPGVFTGDFSTTAYKALGDKFLNHDACVHKLSETTMYASPLGQFFCKPNDDNKAFAGQVFDVRNFEDWVNRMREIGYLDENDFDVVTAPVKPLAIEYRVLVVGDHVADMCIYRQWQSVMPERVWDHDVSRLVYECMQDFVPAPVYIIDVAQTLEGLRVIEYNTFNSAGLYALDPLEVVGSITEYVNGN